MALEDALAKAEERSEKISSGGQHSLRIEEELRSLKAEFKEQARRFAQAIKSREELEASLQQAHEIIDSLEKMLRKPDTEKSDRHSVDPVPATESQKFLELEEQLKSVGLQLEEAQAQLVALNDALADSEMRFAKQQEDVPPRQGERKERRIPESVVVAAQIVAPRVKAIKPLPHELRPAPKDGAFFRPDWDLHGLPCQSSEQVYKAWESAFNVQISLEGYTSQYCMAFLVVLRFAKQKKLYMLFRLKQDKYTLVCVPTITPKNEAALKEGIQEGLKYLKLSGFEMVELETENVESTLGKYFMKG
jgi:hypothetical protein